MCVSVLVSAGSCCMYTGSKQHLAGGQVRRMHWSRRTAAAVCMHIRLYVPYRMLLIPQNCQSLRLPLLLSDGLRMRGKTRSVVLSRTLSACGCPRRIARL